MNAPGTQAESASCPTPAPRAPLILSLIGLAIFFFAIESAWPCFFLHDDNATWFTGAFVHDYRTLAETGRLAEMNFNQYGGEPFLEQGQTSVLYPPVYLAVALAKWISGDVRWTMEWIIAGHLIFGFLGFYFWMREGGAASVHAALGGLAWALNPFVLLTGAGWFMVSSVAAYLPWMFWALDRIRLRSTLESTFLFGLFTALFFLQGAAQWVLYAMLFLALYGAFHLVGRTVNPPVTVVFRLLIAALLFSALTAPLILPMLHATHASAARARPLTALESLVHHVARADVVAAQFGSFRPGLFFGLSTAALYSPALLFLPVMLVGFFRGSAEIQRRLFPLLFLAALAIIFSSRWHLLLTLTPLFERFRWPFKVYIFADFFLLAACVWTVTSWLKRTGPAPRARRLGSICLAVLLVAEVVVSLAGHETNLLSRTTLPTSMAALPPGMDPKLGRVVAMDDILPEASSARFFTHCFSTFFDVPNLGGYNPLVARDALAFALGLDFPNVFTGPISPTVRRQLDAKSVRYWIVDPRSPILKDVASSGGLVLLASEKDRLVFENTHAAPLAFSALAPSTPCAVTFSGNSIFVAVQNAASPVEVSAGPTDGWWCRADLGPWLRPRDAGDRLIVDFPPSTRVVEISYFDPRFREGLGVSACLLVIVGLLVAAGRSARFKRKPTAIKAKASWPEAAAGSPGPSGSTRKERSCAQDKY